jgi:hypothetical protein
LGGLCPEKILTAPAIQPSPPATARQGRFPLWQGHWPMRSFPTTGRRSQLGPGLRWFPSVSAHAAFHRCHPVLTAVKSMWPVRGFRRLRPYRAGDVFPGVVSRTRGLLARVGIHFRAVNIGWNGVLGGGKTGSGLNTIRTDIYLGSARSRWSPGSHRSATCQRSAGSHWVAAPLAKSAMSLPGNLAGLQPLAFGKVWEGLGSLGMLCEALRGLGKVWEGSAGGGGGEF